MDSGPELPSRKVDQVGSDLPALELLPLDCSRSCEQLGGATPMQARLIKLDLIGKQITGKYVYCLSLSRIRDVLCCS